MRVQGGTRGLLAAIDAGWIDPLDPDLDEGDRRLRYNAADWRRLDRRSKRRRKRAERAARLKAAAATPF